MRWNFESYFRSGNLLLSAAILAVFAMHQAAEAGWILNKTVRNVRVVSESGVVAFATVESIENPAGCAGSEFHRISVGDSPKNNLQCCWRRKIWGVDQFLNSGTDQCFQFL